MQFRAISIAIAAMAGLASQAAWGAPSAREEAERAALSQCVSLRTTGADRILAVQWIFAVMSKSPHIADLSTVPEARARELNRRVAALFTRLVTRDCIEEIRPIATRRVQDAFELVGEALGQYAMNELMAGKEAEAAVGAFGDFISPEDFKPLMDSLPKGAR